LLTLCVKVILGNISLSSDDTNVTLMNVELDKELWKSRIREIQGAIIVAPLFEVFLGFSGLVGLLTSFIGPVSITPIIMLIGLALFRVSSTYCASNWWMAFL